MYDVILIKYQKYPSTTMLKHVNVLAKLNKAALGSLPDMMPHKYFSITINVHTMILADISHEQKY